MKRDRLPLEPNLDRIAEFVASFLKACLKANAKQARIVSRDVKNRCLVLRRLNDADFIGTLLYPSLEEAVFYEPRHATETARALVNFCVRNGSLEDAHASHPYDGRLAGMERLRDESIHVVTTKLGEYFHDFLAEMSNADVEVQSVQTPFDHLSRRYPVGWEALHALDDMRKKGELERQMAFENVARPAFKTYSFSEDGFTSFVESAVNPDLPDAFVRLLEQKEGPSLIWFEAFRGISRNIEKLLTVIELCLHHGKEIVTQNHLISRTRLCRRESFLRPPHRDSTSCWRDPDTFERIAPYHKEALLRLASEFNAVTE